MLYTESNSVDECLFKRKVIFCIIEKQSFIEEFLHKVNYENITHFYENMWFMILRSQCKKKKKKGFNRIHEKHPFNTSFQS